MNIEIHFDRIDKILGKRGLEPGGQVQKYIDNEVLRLSDPYTPMYTGMMKKSGVLGTVIGSGKVIWNAPYARYQYYGKVMTGRAPKSVTNKSLTYSGGGLRGSYWFERMKIDRGQEIIDGAARIAGGRAT